jgi:hypothetical protein
MFLTGIALPDMHVENVLPGWASPGKNHIPSWSASTAQKADEADQDLEELLMKLTQISKKLFNCNI